LKIDKVFIDGLNQEPDKVEMARVIVHLGATLKLSTIAEGIEDIQQLQILKDLGCEYGQGHLFSEAITEAEATALLRTGLPFESIQMISPFTEPDLGTLG
jgi:EAL domain-containing protein (putative c-di-GMP-specific phosphodiesterase class I)